MRLGRSTCRTWPFTCCCKTAPACLHGNHVNASYCSSCVRVHSDGGHSLRVERASSTKQSGLVALTTSCKQSAAINQQLRPTACGVFNSRHSRNDRLLVSSACACSTCLGWCNTQPAAAARGLHRLQQGTAAALSCCRWLPAPPRTTRAPSSQAYAPLRSQPAT